MLDTYTYIKTTASNCTTFWFRYFSWTIQMW